MKHVEHPEELYIQIQDINNKNIGFAFTDGEPNGENSCDFNDFDDETRERILYVLRSMYTFIYDHREKNGKPVA